jgi:hypothetical protein
MPEERLELIARGEQLREILLDHLLAAACPPWPGADGLMVDEVLRSYRQHAAAGLVPDAEELLQSYPELREAVIVFFAGNNQSPGEGGAGRVK